MPERNEIRLIGAYQDGKDFYKDQGDYDVDESGLIASYPGIVKHDYDMDGAYEARLMFVRDHPEYGFVVMPERKSPTTSTVPLPSDPNVRPKGT